MTIYDDLKSAASEIMKEFGQGGIKIVTLTESSGEVDEPGTPSETETDLDATVRGVSYKYVQNGFALQSDLMVSSSVVDGVSPKISDFIDIDGVRYKIIQIINLPSAGTALIWKFIVRKGG